MEQLLTHGPPTRHARPSPGVHWYQRWHAQVRDECGYGRIGSCPRSLLRGKGERGGFVASPGAAVYGPAYTLLRRTAGPPAGSEKTTFLTIPGCMLTSTSGPVVIEKRAADPGRPERLVEFRGASIGFVFRRNAR